MTVLHESPRDRRRRRKEELILDAAMERVVSDGLSGLSINKLAADVDYTPGALYRYFDSKDALVSALVSRVLDELRGRLGEIEATDPLPRIIELVRGYRRFAMTQPEKFGLLAMTMAEPRLVLPRPSDAEPAMQAMIRALTPLASALTEARTVGAIGAGDDVQRALILFASAQGSLLLRKQARHAPGLIDVHAMSDEAMRALLIGWGADPAEVEGLLS